MSRGGGVEYNRRGRGSRLCSIRWAYKLRGWFFSLEEYGSYERVVGCG